MLNASLCLLTLTQLFLQTHAGTFVQSPSALDKNFTGSIDLKLDDGKPIPNNPYKIFPFHLLDHTNLNNDTRTCFQPAATQPIQIKGVDNSSCTSHFVIKMLDMTIIIRSKVSIQTGRSDNYENILTIRLLVLNMKKKKKTTKLKLNTFTFLSRID